MGNIFDLKDQIYYTNVVRDPEIVEGMEVIGHSGWRMVAAVYRGEDVEVPRGWLRVRSEGLIQADLKRHGFVHHDSFSAGVAASPMQIRMEVGEDHVPTWLVMCGGLKLAAGFTELEDAKQWCAKEYPKCTMRVVLGASVDRALKGKRKTSNRHKVPYKTLGRVHVPARMVDDLDSEAKLQGVPRGVIVRRMLAVQLEKMGYHTNGYGST